MSEGKDFYRAHCPPDAPLFHLPWWLDTVCGNEWQAAVINEGDELKAYYLYAQKGNRPGSPIYMPHLTQFLGPGYRLTETGVRQRNNEETEILEHLLAQLPAFSSFESRWNHRYQNWLPFHWQHFQQRTRYTYVIEDLADPEKLRAGFSDKVKREILKAEKDFHVETVADAGEFYHLISKNLREKRVSIPFSQLWLQQLFSTCHRHHAGKILLAKNAEQESAAGIFIAWDANTLYYLIGAKDDQFGNSGAMSFLFWNVFQEWKDSGKMFDFEGSMLKGVENYFRSFGAVQKGFFEITKIRSFPKRIKNSIRMLLR